MKKIILKIGSLILLLITTILISIGTFSCSTKENNNAYLFNNIKIKRAFENAPEKETSLPGLNKTFDIFLNVSTIQEFKNFHIELNENYNLSSNPDTISTIAILKGNMEVENQNFTLHLILYSYCTNNKIYFTVGGTSNSSPLSEAFVSTYDLINETMTFKTEDSDITTIENDLQVQQFSNNFNDTFSGGFGIPFISIEQVQLSILFKVSDIGLNSNYIYGYNVVSNSAVPNLINIIKDSSTGILNMIIELFIIAIPIFWVNNKLTFIGTLAFFTVAVPIVYWVINFVLNLIKKIKLSRK